MRKIIGKISILIICFIAIIVCFVKMTKAEFYTSYGTKIENTRGLAVYGLDHPGSFINDNIPVGATLGTSGTEVDLKNRSLLIS